MIRKAVCRRKPGSDSFGGGIDMVQFGPADYSMSIGVPGQWKDPRIKEAERYTIETALKKGCRREWNWPISGTPSLI